MVELITKRLEIGIGTETPPRARARPAPAYQKPAAHHILPSPVGTIFVGGGGHCYRKCAKVTFGLECRRPQIELRPTTLACPTGKSTQDMGQFDEVKIYRWLILKIRNTTPAILSHQRGVGHRRKRGTGSGGRGARLTSVAFAYGEIVWVRRPVQASSWQEAKASSRRWCHEKRVTRTISYKP